MASTLLMFLCLLILTPISSEDLCKWYGIAPFCFIGNSCPDGCFKLLESSKGDGATCWFSTKKQCCCPKRVFDSIVNSITSNKKK